ncbi:hypothetical protein BD626DRAFT_514411 [Schizophyllum amplum]|uniref:Geranylgeranyl transferase type-2 subunit alpha n=1 Tax=Schizophyllum amplum TaxID=97359 RepID=A0A550BYF9_9AGAR|nr:hypothetical protein BD626DRAFT_514411 [Auriculariopsis ampla]
MHGIKRVVYTTEALEAKKKREQARMQEYLALNDAILTKKRNHEMTREAFDLTTKMLEINPEFYTVWNYRRNILTNALFPQTDKEGINALLSNDLALTTAALKAHPKVYGIWNHRRWCLANVPDGPGTAKDGDSNGWRQDYWNKELYLAERMLDADSRNFHAWNYRRYALENMPVSRPTMNEMDYTMQKIKSNFSNFSAWHHRSKVLPSLWESGQLQPSSSRETEFDLVRNAMYTDPNDQSVWMYHRWLVGSGDDRSLLEREIAAIQELLDAIQDEPDEGSDVKWCMESIVHYKRLLLRKHALHVDNHALTKDCLSLLEDLQKQDPARRQRYKDIGAHLIGAVPC